MFSGFFGKGDKGAKPPKKEGGVKSRGVEVIEDDPDTAWGLWDSALAEQDSRFTAPLSGAAPLAESLEPPQIDFDSDNAATQPMPLEEITLDHRKDDALRVVEMHHQRIANTIRSLWGYKECSEYINKLVMSGGDGMGQARIGFNQSAAESMLVLADIHDQLFGAELDASIDFTNIKRTTGWDKLR